MRSFTHLQLSDRKVIYNMLRHKKKYTEIAIALNVHRSTIINEIKRNSRGKTYDPETAQRIYEARLQSVKYVKKFSPNLFDYLKEHIKGGHSPDSIAGRLKYHPDAAMHVSTQTIYNWAHQRALGNELYKHLLFGKKGYRKRADKAPDSPKKRVEDIPTVDRERNRLGDFEGDTIVGAKQKGAILTLVDRMSLYILAGKLADRTKESFAITLQDTFSDIDNDKLKTLVFDNESAMNDFKSNEEMLNIEIFFTHPGRPWEKPIIENANRLP